MGVAVSVGVVVAVRVGGSGVAVVVLVTANAGLVGDGVMVETASVTDEAGVWVSVRGCGGAGVRVWRRDMLVGVGVSRKTPVITGSFSSACPSSRRIISSTAGSMGATFS